MNPLASTLFIVLFVITAMGLVLSIGLPTLERAKATMEFREVERMLLQLDSIVKQVASGEMGRMREVALTFGEGSIDVREESDTITYKLWGIPLFDYLTRKARDNVFYITGNDVSCSKSGQGIIMQNSYLTIYLKQYGSRESPTEIDSSNVILGMENRLVGKGVFFSNSSILVDGMLVNGTGYLDLATEGDNMPFCVAKLHFDQSSVGDDIDFLYVLFAGADFLVIEQRGISDPSIVQQGLAFHLSENDALRINNVTYFPYRFADLSYENFASGTFENTTIELYGELSLDLTPVTYVDEVIVNASYGKALGKCKRLSIWGWCRECDENYVQAEDYLNITLSDDNYLPLNNSPEPCPDSIEVSFPYPIVSDDVQIVSVSFEVEYRAEAWVGWPGEDWFHLDDFYVWNGSNWIYAGDWGGVTGDEDEVWTSMDLSSIIDTPAKVNGLKLKLYANPIGWEGYVYFDQVRLRVVYTYQQLEFYSFGTFTSRSYDAGKEVNVTTIYFDAEIPANTSIKFQIAVSSDNASWNFVGPDGTSNSYFTASGEAMQAQLSGRFVRYRAYLETNDTSVTPRLKRVAVFFMWPEQSYADPIYEYVGARGNDLTVALLFAGRELANVSLVANYSFYDYLLALSQFAGRARFLLAVTNATFDLIENRAAELRRDRMIWDNFAGITQAAPGEVYNSLVIFYDEIDLANTTKIGSGSTKLLLQNLGKTSSGRRRIAVSLS